MKNINSIIFELACYEQEKIKVNLNPQEEERLDNSIANCYSKLKEQGLEKQEIEDLVQEELSDRNIIG